jgi:hypothetical protein
MSRASATRTTPASTGDDRVQHLRGDDRALGLLVDVGQEAVEVIGGEEEAERLVVDAVDRHAEVVEQAGPGDHDLGVVGAQPVVGLDRRAQPARVQQPEQAQRDVEHDPQVHPRVVAHAEPLRGHLRRVPARLEALVGVGGAEQAGELRVALAGCGDPHGGDGVARRAPRHWGRCALHAGHSEGKAIQRTR